MIVELITVTVLVLLLPGMVLFAEACVHVITQIEEWLSIEDKDND